MKKLQRDKGITLISLVITIIILLILVGVGIAMLVGDNGILLQANNTKEKHEEVSKEESIKLEVIASFDKNGKYNSVLAKQNLEKNLGAIVEKNGKNDTLKVTYKGEDFLLDQKGNVFKIEIPKDLKVGDVVAYTPKAQEYLWEEKYSGNETDVKINNTTKEYSITNWKILNINNNGTIDLIPEKPTAGTVPLGYAQGYNNGVKLLNDACNQLYGDKDLGIVSRSINEEDIKEKMTDEALESIKNQIQLQHAYSSENSKYPIIYASENLSTINGNKKENGLERNEQEKFIEKNSNQATDGAIINAQSIQPYHTYWYKNKQETEKIFKNIEIEPSIQYYNLFMPNGGETKYWLASRSVTIGELNCYFGMRMVHWRN